MLVTITIVAFLVATLVGMLLLGAAIVIAIGALDAEIED